MDFWKKKSSITLARRCVLCVGSWTCKSGFVYHLRHAPMRPYIIIYCYENGHRWWGFNGHCDSFDEQWTVDNGVGIGIVWRLHLDRVCVWQQKLVRCKWSHVGLELCGSRLRIKMNLNPRWLRRLRVRCIYWNLFVIVASRSTTAANDATMKWATARSKQRDCENLMRNMCSAVACTHISVTWALRRGRSRQQRTTAIMTTFTLRRSTSRYTCTNRIQRIKHVRRINELSDPQTHRHDYYLP